MSSKEEEYNKLKKMGEEAGLEDLMKIYGEYKRLVDMSEIYLQTMQPKLTFSTTDSSA
jgi:hypothetical protein